MSLVAMSHSHTQLFVLALILAFVIVICFALTALFVYRRIRTRQSQFLSVSPVMLEEGAVAAVFQVDPNIERKNQGTTTTHVPILSYKNLRLARPPPAVIAGSRTQLTLPVLQRVGLDKPAPLLETSPTHVSPLLNMQGESGPSTSVSVSSLVSVDLDASVISELQYPVHEHGPASASPSDISPPPLGPAFAQIEEIIACNMGGACGPPVSLSASTDFIPLALDSSASVERQHLAHEQTPSSATPPSATSIATPISTPSLVSCASTPELASDCSSVACWEIQTQLATPSSLPSTPTQAAPLPVSSSVYSYRRLSLPFTDARTEKIQAVDVSVSTFSSSSSPDLVLPETPLKSKPKTESKSNSNPDSAAKSALPRQTRERPLSVVGPASRPRPLSTGVGLGFNFLLGFDAGALSFPSPDDLSGSENADAETDEALYLAADDSSQTVTALSASDSGSDSSAYDSEETISGDWGSDAGNRDSASKRLSDLVGALDAVFSIANFKAQHLGVGVVSPDDDLELLGSEFLGDQHFRREVHVYAF